MGTHRIASYLTNKGISSSTEDHWHSSSINAILKNKTYIGILKCGDVFSECLEHLRIIDDSTFFTTQEILSSNKARKPMADSPNRLKTQVLCADLLYCAHCEGKMGLTSNPKVYTRKDGTVSEYRRVRYICINKCRHKKCDGQTGYSSSKLDAALITYITDMLQSSQLDINKDLIYRQHIEQDETLRRDITETEHKLRQEEETLFDLQNEVISVIRGTSAFGSVLLTQLMNRSERHIESLNEELKRQNVELQNHSDSMQIFAASYINLTATLSAIEELPLEEKQRVLRHCIRKIHIDRNYEIRIDWMFLSPDLNAICSTDGCASSTKLKKEEGI